MNSAGTARRRRWWNGRGSGQVVMLLLVAVTVIAGVMLREAWRSVPGIVPWLAAAVVVSVVCAVRFLDPRNLGEFLRSFRTRRSERFMREVVERSHDAILTVEPDGAIVTCNPAARRMFADPDGRALAGDVGTLICPADGTNAEALTETGIHEAVGRRLDGSAFPVEVSVSELDGTDRPMRVVLVRDITSRKDQEQALLHRATHDGLTGLPNRLMLHEELTRSLAEAAHRGEPVALAILDLDHFKDINDTLGHPIGDLLLRLIGERLGSAVRPADTIARLGGDEFAVVLRGSDRAKAVRVADRLTGALSEPFRLEGLSLKVGTSIGIALFPEHGDEAIDLIQRADVAMYVAKRNHGGVSMYRPEDDFSSVRQLTLNGELRRAIEDDRLALFYQPKIASRTGRVVSVEALVRWIHPTHGILPPDEFIGLAEHSGLIRPLTRWVLQQAIRQCAAWRKRGVELSVAVNLSARNLLENDLPGVIGELLVEHGLVPEGLTLEITENLIMDDPRRSMEVITELNAMGVGIAIDDFGTGYSSLAYLKRMPAAEIKIDRSFVSDMDRQRDDAVIVGSTIEMAHSLGLEVVAEGVETRAVWNKLQMLGCDFGQGYLFSRPLPVDKLEAWLRETDYGLRSAGNDDSPEAEQSSGIPAA